jgi:hypothetical protein
MSQLISLSFLSIILFLTGCTSTQQIDNNNPILNQYEQNTESSYYENKKYITQSNNKLLNFDTLTNNLTTPDICKNLKNNSTLYVTDFVNQKNLQNNSQLGFILSNALKVNLMKKDCSTNISIKTFNLQKYLSVSKKGTSILTNNLDKMKTTSLEDDKQIAIGTYAITSNQLILFLKLVNLEDSNTVASSSTTTPITKEVLELEGVDMENEQPYIQKPFHL